ncbi:alkaline phosphatase family protein [soil metagenome]
MRTLRPILILLPTLALVGAAVWFFTKSPKPDTEGDPAAAEGGRLLVIVVFDQLRGDYLRNWNTAFGPDGFEKLKRDGVWYSNTTLPYACSATGPGHASIVTGAPPSVHGIVENGWFNREKGKLDYASSAEEAYPRVPPSAGDKSPGLAPSRLLAPTITDSLKAGTSAKGRLFSLSLKDRAAVLMGGKDPAGVYCFDSSTGEFHTSKYYRDRLPAWVEQFNKSDIPNRWGGKTWDRLGTATDYDRLAGPDNQPGEDGAIITLPKTLPTADSGGIYYSALERTPFGNELLWEFTKAAIAAEKLGTHGSTDVLCVSFSSNDIIGHANGPNSHEVLDVTLRSDKLIGEMIKYLDETVGKEKYSLVVTSDHGIAPLPEVAVKTHPEATRIIYGDLVNGLEEALDDTFFGKSAIARNWVEADFKNTRPWVFLNRRLIESTGVPFVEVESYARKWLANRPDAVTAFSRSQLVNGLGPNATADENKYFDAVKQAFHPDRCGDIYIVQRPYTQLTGKAGFGRGVDHGTVFDYDRDVFILAYGARVPKLGLQDKPMSSLAVTPMVCKLLGITPPEKAMEKLPTGW